jgi:hypothetical protein
MENRELFRHTQDRRSAGAWADARHAEVPQVAAWDRIREERWTPSALVDRPAAKRGVPNRKPPARDSQDHSSHGRDTRRSREGPGRETPTFQEPGHGAPAPIHRHLRGGT